MFKVMHRDDGKPHKKTARLSRVSMELIAEKFGGKFNSRTMLISIPWEHKGTFIVSVTGDVQYLGNQTFIKSMEMSVRSFKFVSDNPDTFNAMHERAAKIKEALTALETKARVICRFVSEQIRLSTLEAAHAAAYMDDVNVKPAHREA